MKSGDSVTNFGVGYAFGHLFSSRLRLGYALVTFKRNLVFPSSEPISDWREVLWMSDNRAPVFCLNKRLPSDGGLSFRWFRAGQRWLLPWADAGS